MKFLLASMKSITNCKIPSSNPLQRVCSGFLIAACVSKSCSKTRLGNLKIVPKAGYECILGKIDKESKGMPKHKFDETFGTNFINIIIKCFQRSKQKLLINFSLAQKFSRTIQLVT
jgi:hypothetical protein